jgi:recombination DNA repair RAD52 pathway protein
MAKKKSLRKQISLMIRPASLPELAKSLLQLPTPMEFIKQRPGKGNKTFTYVEGGYVIARLNQIFSPVGWDFQVVSERVEPNEVVVRGRLMIKDHKNGYTVSKTQYGTKERNAGVPLGDTLKAAATDSLKKCASLFGVALDVYWQQLDETSLNTEAKRAKTEPQIQAVPSKNASMPITKAQLLKISLDKIKAENDQTILSQYYERITHSTVYDEQQKKLLIRAISQQRQKYVKENPNSF